MAGIDNTDADLSTVDKFIIAFKENGYDQCVLYHHVRGEPTKRSKTRILEDQLYTQIPTVPQESEALDNDGVNAKNKTCKVGVYDCTAVANSFSAMSNYILLPHNEQIHNMQSFAKSHQPHFGLEDTQDLTIGCDWTIPAKKHLFKIFSEVLHIDCTADTHQDNRPFLTITGCDSNGNMFTII
jgi:hypothetical protein